MAQHLIGTKLFGFFSRRRRPQVTLYLAQSSNETSSPLSGRQPLRMPGPLAYLGILDGQQASRVATRANMYIT